MDLIKYNKYKEGKVYASQLVSTTSSSNSSTSSSTDRTLWGNSDSGNDINDSMKIEGNIYVKAFDPSTESRAGDDDYDENEDEEKDEDFEEEEFPPEDEDPNGSIFADGNIYCKELEANDVYAKNHLYINDPQDNQKKDVVDIIKDYNERITSNTDRIETLEEKVDELGIDNIEQMQNNIQMCIGGVDANTQRIYSLGNNINSLSQELSDAKVAFDQYYELNDSKVESLHDFVYAATNKINEIIDVINSKLNANISKNW